MQSCKYPGSSQGNTLLVKSWPSKRYNKIWLPIFCNPFTVRLLSVMLTQWQLHDDDTCYLFLLRYLKVPCLPPSPSPPPPPPKRNGWEVKVTVKERYQEMQIVVEWNKTFTTWCTSDRFAHTFLNLEFVNEAHMALHFILYTNESDFTLSHIHVT